MRGAFALVILALGACGEPPAQQPGNTAPPERSASPAKTPAPSIEGWQTDITAFDFNGTTLPAFVGKKSDGSELTVANLRGRWTILGFAQPGDEPGETAFIAALNSAADQDPDLDFLGVMIKRGDIQAADRPVSWPSISDAGALADALRITRTPAYVLVGPDLTIEAYREALAATPGEGIKPVIRGIAQIRKQIAAPQ